MHTTGDSLKTVGGGKALRNMDVSNAGFEILKTLALQIFQKYRFNTFVGPQVFIQYGLVRNTEGKQTLYIYKKTPQGFNFSIRCISWILFSAQMPQISHSSNCTGGPAPGIQ